MGELYGRRVDDLRTDVRLTSTCRARTAASWNLDALRESKEIILCEALIDALTFWCAGFRNVTSSFGTNGFTDEMLEAMKAYGTERVLIAYDRDEAGDRAAAKLGERLAAEGITCYRVLFPRGMDANDYALKVTPAEQSLARPAALGRVPGGPAADEPSRNASPRRQLNKGRSPGTGPLLL